MSPGERLWRPRGPDEWYWHMGLYYAIYASIEAAEALPRNRAALPEVEQAIVVDIERLKTRAVASVS